MTADRSACWCWTRRRPVPPTGAMAWGAERLILCGDGDAGGMGSSSTSGTRYGCTVRRRRRRSPCCPRPSGRPGREPGGGGRRGVHPLHASRPAGPARHPSRCTLVRPAGPAPETVTGVLGRASAPADKYFDTVRRRVPRRRAGRTPAPRNAVARPLDRRRGPRVRRGHARRRPVLLGSGSGTSASTGCRPTPCGPSGGLRLRVLPFAADAPVHLPVPVPVGEAAITRVEWVTGTDQVGPAGDLPRSRCATVPSGGLSCGPAGRGTAVPPPDQAEGSDPMTRSAGGGAVPRGAADATSRERGR